MAKLFVFALLILASIVSCQDNNLYISIQEPSESQGLKESIELEDKPVESSEDLCAMLNCKETEICVFVDDKALCQCFERCEMPKDKRLMICSSSNQTYESECHFNREKCWCERGDSKCKTPEVTKEELDYFGVCQFTGECSEDQRKAFPSRIKKWFDDVLSILNARGQLDKKKYGALVSMANRMKKEKVEKFWTAGVVFEFCELDTSHNGVLESDELKELIAPIKSLESCIQPFLESCDADKDSKITEVEWGQCLDLSSDDTELLRKACK